MKEMMYQLTGGYQQYESQNISLSQFANMTGPLWTYLNELKPYLYDQGNTYPASINDLNTLFNNGQVGLSMTFAGEGIEPQIASGQLPSTAKVYCMNDSIDNTNYVAIPWNAGAKAAAMVVANILLEPQMQEGLISLTGSGPSIDLNNLTGWQATDINAAMSSLPQGTYVPQSELAIANTTAPDVSGYLENYMTTLWDEKVNTV